MTYAQALQTLLHRPDGDRVQVLYLRLASGKILVFLGAPMTQEEYESIEDCLLGEQIPPVLIGLSNALNYQQAQ